MTCRSQAPGVGDAVSYVLAVGQLEVDPRRMTKVPGGAPAALPSGTPVDGVTPGISLLEGRPARTSGALAHRGRALDPCWA